MRRLCLPHFLLLVESDAGRAQAAAHAVVPQRGVERGIDPPLDRVSTDCAIHDSNTRLDRCCVFSRNTSDVLGTLLVRVAHTDSNHTDHPVDRCHSWGSGVHEPQPKTLEWTPVLR